MFLRRPTLSSLVHLLSMARSSQMFEILRSPRKELLFRITATPITIELDAFLMFVIDFVLLTAILNHTPAVIWLVCVASFTLSARGIKSYAKARKLFDHFIIRYVY